MVKIEMDEKGLPIAPPSCAAYGDMIKYVNRTMVASTVKMVLEAHVGALTSTRAAYAESGEADIDSIDAVRDLTKTVDEIRSYFEALVGDGAEAAARVERQVAAMQTMQAAAAAEGATATQESYEAAAKAQMDAIFRKDPLTEALSTRYRSIARDCCRYSPPAYATKVLLDGEPVLKRVIEGYKDNSGADAFGDDLLRGMWTVDFDPAKRPLYLAVIDEVCAPSETRWDDVKTAVLLVAARFASLSLRMYWDKAPEARTVDMNGVVAYLDAHDGENFNEAKEVVKRHVESLTATLSFVEADMRASGDFQRLADLGAQVEPPPTTLRQDGPNYLGRRADYVANLADFTHAPAVYPGQSVEYAREKNMPLLYLWTEPLFALLDGDVNAVLRGYLAMGQQVYDQSYREGVYKEEADERRFNECIADTQPYALYLINLARRVVTIFDEKLVGLFGTRYDKAPIKGLLRCNEKVREDYSVHQGFAMPTAAHLLDIVRGLVSCATVDDMVEAFHVVEASFDVLRVKNGFVPDDVAYGFRQILVNVRVPCPDDSENNSAMVCEIQLNLAAYVHVKHQIHRFYSLLRCEAETGIDQLLRKKAHPF